MSYLDKSGLTYLWTKIKTYIGSATVAAAVKATKDGDGKVIADTYLPKANIMSVAALPDSPEEDVIYLVQESS